MTLLSEDVADREALNIGSTDNIEILTLTEEIRNQIATELEFAERHDADAEHTHADSSKLGSCLGMNRRGRFETVSRSSLSGIVLIGSGTNRSFIVISICQCRSF